MSRPPPQDIFPNLELAAECHWYAKEQFCGHNFASRFSFFFFPFSPYGCQSRNTVLIAFQVTEAGTPNTVQYLSMPVETTAQMVRAMVVHAPSGSMGACNPLYASRICKDTAASLIFPTTQGQIFLASANLALFPSSS